MALGAGKFSVRTCTVGQRMSIPMRIVEEKHKIRTRKGERNMKRVNARRLDVALAMKATGNRRRDIDTRAWFCWNVMRGWQLMAVNGS
jgi:hypothetical protein